MWFRGVKRAAGANAIDDSAHESITNRIANAIYVTDFIITRKQCEKATITLGFFAFVCLLICVNCMRESGE